MSANLPLGVLSNIGKPPIAESSVPGDLQAAIHYAHRLEQRFYKDQERILEADRKLSIALHELGELQMSKEVAVAIAALRAAREILL